MDTHRHSAARIAAVAGIVLGLAAGSYGVASAASRSGSSGSTGSTAATGSVLSQGLASNAAQLAPGGQAPNASNPWGAQRSDETLLTGDAKAKVEAAALTKVPGGTIVRVETDADGHAAYEAHMTKQDGTPVTVYVDKQYQVVSVESR